MRKLFTLALIAFLVYRDIPPRPQNVAAPIYSGQIVFIISGGCPAGFTESTAFNGNYMLGTIAANGDVGSTGGSDSYTPAGTNSTAAFTPAGSNSAPALTMNSYTPGGTNSTGTVTPLGSNSTASFTPAGSNSGGSFSEGAISWPVNVPTNASGAFSEGAISWPAGVPTFAGAALATHTHTLTPTGTNATQSITSASTEVPVTSPSKYVFSTLNSAAAASSSPSITIPAEVFTGALDTSSAVSAGTPSGTVAWPAGVPTIAGGNRAAYDFLAGECTDDRCRQLHAAHFRGQRRHGAGRNLHRRELGDRRGEFCRQCCRAHRLGGCAHFHGNAWHGAGAGFQRQPGHDSAHVHQGDRVREKLGSKTKMRMLRNLFLLAAVCLAPFAARAQSGFIQVSGTVVDPNGFPYSGGSTGSATISAALVPAGISSATLYGNRFATSVGPAALQNDGSFTLALADNTIVSPANTQWQFTVTGTSGLPWPLGRGSQSFTVTLTIHGNGTSQDISSSLNADAPSLTNVCANGNLGSFTCGPGSGGNPCTASPNSIQYDNAGTFGCIPESAYSTASGGQLVWTANRIDLDGHTSPSIIFGNGPGGCSSGPIGVLYVFCSFGDTVENRWTASVTNQAGSFQSGGIGAGASGLEVTASGFDFASTLVNQGLIQGFYAAASVNPSITSAGTVADTVLAAEISAQTTTSTTSSLVTNAIGLLVHNLYSSGTNGTELKIESDGSNVGTLLSNHYDLHILAPANPVLATNNWALKVDAGAGNVEIDSSADFSSASSFKIPNTTLSGYLDVVKEASPGNPSSGNIRVYGDSTSGNLTCLTSSGGNCLPSGTVTSIASFEPDHRRHDHHHRHDRVCHLHHFGRIAHRQ